MSSAGAARPQAEATWAGVRPGDARSLRAADREATWTGTMNGLTDPYMIPYALALGASPLQSWLLSSARSLLLALVQLGTRAGVQAVGSRRTLTLWTTAAQAVVWIPLALVAPLFGSAAVPALIVLYTLGTAMAAIGLPAWGSLVADHVPADQRGRYFGRRARLSGIAVTVAGLVAGAVLHLTDGRAVLGFGLLCGGAFLARALALRCVGRCQDMGWHDDPEPHVSFLAFLRQIRQSEVGQSEVARLSLCVAANSLAAQIAAPFFAVYLLESLGYDYLEYACVTFGGAVTGMLTSPWWGRIGDRSGTRAVLCFTMWGVAALPLLWLLHPHPLWMTAVNVAGAFLWGGLHLSASNFLYDAAPASRRHTCIAYFNVLCGLGVSAGALLGGWLATVAGPAHAPYLAVFAVSALLRAGTAFAFGRCVREVRATPVTPLSIVLAEGARESFTRRGRLATRVAPGGLGGGTHRRRVAAAGTAHHGNVHALTRRRRRSRFAPLDVGSAVRHVRHLLALDRRLRGMTATARSVPRDASRRDLSVQGSRRADASGASRDSAISPSPTVVSPATRAETPARRPGTGTRAGADPTRG